MKNFRDLKVWNKAHSLTLAVYKATAAFPREELYGLTGQIRRSCISVPANLSEGCGRGSQAEFGISSKSQWDQLASLNTIFSWRVIWDI